MKLRHDADPLSQMNAASQLDLRVSRRRVLQWAAMMSAGSALAPFGHLTANAEAANVLGPIADNHCHIFNIRDLPAAGFIKSATLGAGGDGWLAKALYEFFDFAVQKYRKGTPTAEQELAALETLDPETVQPAAPENDHEAIQIVGNYLADVNKKMDAAVPRRRLGGGLPINNLAGATDKIGGAPIHNAFAIYQESKSGEQDFKIQTTILDLNGQAKWHAIAKQAMTDVEKISSGGAELSAQQIEIFEKYNRLTGGLWSSAVIHAVRWIMMFKFPRHRILKSEMDLHTGTTPRIYVPALVDFELWVGPKDETITPQAKQNEVMTAISKKFSKPGRYVGYYCAFDPMRQLLDGSALPSLEKALKDGAAGAKIYPPMGFRLSGNAMVEGDFGIHVPKEVGAKYQNTPASLGAALDVVLRQAYKTIVENDAAVITHVSFSQGVARPAGSVVKTGAVQANPEFAKRMLKAMLMEEGAPAKNLRLNLGHAGGPWCLREIDRPKGCAFMGGTAWFVDVMRLLADKRYAHVYADLADFDLVRDAKRDNDFAAFDDTVKAFAAIVKAIPVDAQNDRTQIPKRLMYGTDFVFLGMSPGAGKYAGNFKNVFARKLAKELGPDIVPDKDQFAFDLMFGNAVRFLGLDQQPRFGQDNKPLNARARIEQATGQNFSWIDETMRRNGG